MHSYHVFNLLQPQNELSLNKSNKQTPPVNIEARASCSRDDLNDEENNFPSLLSPNEIDLDNKNKTDKNYVPPLVPIKPRSSNNIKRYELNENENILPTSSNTIKSTLSTSNPQKRKLNSSLPDTKRKIPKSSEKTRRFVNLTRMHEDNAIF